MRSAEGQTVYELRLSCGMEVLCAQFFTGAEPWELTARLAALE